MYSKKMLIIGLWPCGPNPPHANFIRLLGERVAFDVGTRSRRRASQPRPGEVASRCLSRARKSSPARYARSSCHLLTRSASSARARPGREAQEGSAAPGRPSFWLLFLGRTRKSNPPPRGERHHCFSSITAGNSTRCASVPYILITAFVGMTA